MSLAALLQRVVDVLADAGVPHMLTGSLAAAYYSVPRATQDVDVVVAPTEDGILRVVRALSQAGYYVDRAAALEALKTRGQFNAIDPETGWKVDLIIRKDRPFSETEFDRRERASVFGIEVSLTTLEDLLVAKLEWAKIGDSALQRADVRQLLENRGHDIDRVYVETWVERLGLDDEWRAVGGGP